MEMKRFYQKIMYENPNLIKDVKETKKTVDAIQQHTFFKEYLKEDDKIKKNIMEMEECFINAMEIRQLFNGNTDEIKFKIKELQNAAQVAKAILELSEIENLMLKTIVYSSKIQVMDLLDEWFIYLRSIFNRLPSDENLKDEAKNFAKEYKLEKEETKIDLGGDTHDQATETSESDSEDADDEASEKSESDNVDNNNDTNDDSGTINGSDEDFGNGNDDTNSIPKDESEADDEASDISRKDDQDSTESVNESDR